jgi:hypothetical protein
VEAAAGHERRDARAEGLHGGVLRERRRRHVAAAAGLRRVAARSCRVLRSKSWSANKQRASTQRGVIFVGATNEDIDPSPSK